MASLQKPVGGPKGESEKPADNNHMDNYTSSRSLVEQDRKAAYDGVPTQEDWRELARLIQSESDPQRLVELVQQLISRFDEEKLRKVLQTGADTK
jgi:hypothetical protein